MHNIPKNVRILSIVSFFNDIASEMVYPVVPLFLTSVIGAPIAAVGVIEGIAEATTSFLRIASGWISDKMQERKKFVVFGYSLATAGKFVLGFAGSTATVLAGRFLDKVGKGTRTAPRDALIADSTPRGLEGEVFGFHRAFDSLGAVLGPLIAIALISSLGGNLRPIFFIAAIPALIGVLLLIFFVSDSKRNTTLSVEEKISWDWKKADPRFAVFLFASVVFSLGNSSDAFLILRAKDLGMSITTAIFAYTLFNLTYAIFSYPAGKLSDKIGAKKMLVYGFLIFALVYGVLGLINSPALVWLLFPIYGIYMALTDGIGKAYVSELVPRRLSGTAFGIYQGAVGICILFASIFAGFAYEYIGGYFPFLFGACSALLASFVIART